MDPKMAYSTAHFDPFGRHDPFENIMQPGRLILGVLAI